MFSFLSISKIHRPLANPSPVPVRPVACVDDRAGTMSGCKNGCEAFAVAFYALQNGIAPGRQLLKRPALPVSKEASQDFLTDRIYRLSANPYSLLQVMRYILVVLEEEFGIKGIYA